jgi:hypothetical protein
MDRADRERVPLVLPQDASHVSAGDLAAPCCARESWVRAGRTPAQETARPLVRRPAPDATESRGDARSI